MELLILLAAIMYKPARAVSGLALVWFGAFALGFGGVAFVLFLAFTQPVP